MELRVVGLDGGEFHFCVPEETSGQELLQQLRQKLQVKPSTTLALLHENTRISSGKSSASTLKEILKPRDHADAEATETTTRRDIGSQKHTLCFVYQPVNVHRCWTCLTSACLDDDALDGLTSIRYGKRNLHPEVKLPESLTTLCLDDDFNQALDEMYLPKGLKSLSFGFEFNKRLDRISLPSSLESLAFGYCFNKPLEHLKLPDGLKSLTLGSNFQQSLEFVELPNMLQELTFGESFNQSLKQIDVPSGLRCLTLGAWYNQSLEAVTLPSHLKTLTFGHFFNQSLERVCLPAGLESLTFGNTFNQSLDLVTLPIGLLSLRLGDGFTKPMHGVRLPTALRSLIFGCAFKQCSRDFSLPNLRTLVMPKIGDRSDIEGLPGDLQSLTLSHLVNHGLQCMRIPSGLRSLHFGFDFHESLRSVQLHFSLESLTLGGSGEQPCSLRAKAQ